MDLTTLARVRAHLGLESDFIQDDALLSKLITAWSAAIETYLDREVLAQAYVEILDVDDEQMDFWIKNWPITALTDIRNDTARAFGTGTIVSAINYAVYQNEDGHGRIGFDNYRPVKGKQVLRISYTGGMAATTAAFVAAYPSLALAADMQVAWAYARKGQVGILNVSGTGGSITLPGQHSRGPIIPHEQFVPEIRAILDQFTRVGVGL